VPAINVVRVDTENNKARFYKLDVQPTLFGEWSLVREWGRIGQPGTVQVEMHGTRGAADIALISAWIKRLKRGYL
jgi:predicted DNA-binding WGR domain protein